jgi:hypothetical protein
MQLDSWRFDWPLGLLSWPFNPCFGARISIQAFMRAFKVALLSQLSVTFYPQSICLHPPDAFT